MILLAVNDPVKILSRMNENPKGIRFADLRKICELYFGEPRQSKGSHCIFKTPWRGDPRINIQNDKGKAKPYQVKQVLHAIHMLKVNDDN